MPFLFIMAIVFAIILVVAGFVFGGSGRDSDTRAFAGIVAAIAFAMTAILTLGSSANSVPIRNVGIVTSFNKPTGATTGSGLHFVKPWEKLAEWDASIQTDDGKAQVRISTGAVATVPNKVRWQVKADAAPKQFNDYKGDFENMRKNLFEAEKQAAFNEVFASYNPISQVGPDGKVAYDLGKLAEDVKALLTRKLGSDFVIHSVVIPIIEHDAQTQQAIEEFQKVVTQGRTLEQKNKNADTELAIAGKLKNLPEGYSVNRCLDIAEKNNTNPGLCVNPGIITGAK